MESHPLYGKRKRKTDKNANSLFIKWLTEWRDEAAEKGCKSHFTFKKALSSLKRFPLKLERGKDCKILKHFGDKICKMLDEKLDAYLAAGGTESTSQDSDESVRGEILQNKVSKQSHKSTRPRQVTSTESGSISRILDVSKSTLDKRPASVSALIDSLDSEEDHEEKKVEKEGNGHPPSKRRRSGGGGMGGGREYSPIFRSGGYAILLTLYMDMKSPASQGFMTKAELIRAAQPLADKSFTVPDPGCRYTAWSSMGTLINKGLVIKESSPAKFSLTDSGCKLAHRLESVENGDQFGKGSRGTQQVPARSSAGVEPKIPQILNTASSQEDDVRDDERMTGSAAPQLRLKFCYVTEDGNEVLFKDRAQVTVDDDISVGFLIKCNYQELLQSEIRYKLDNSRPLEDDFVYAFIHDADALDIATLGNQVFYEVDPIQPPAQCPEPKMRKLSKQCFEGRRATRKLSEPQLLPLLSSLSSLNSNVTSTSTKSSATISLQSQDTGGSQASTFSESSASSTKTSSDFVLRPGEFDIILCIDNQEYYGGKGSSKPLLHDLMKNGIECDLRRLHVGDMLWIAREKTHAVPGQLTKLKGRELVLDYIIERKRMDDLVSSFVDGRFKEQKFRLKHCGLRYPIYLVEDYGSMQHFSISEDRIKQAITNTQVVDRFQVKRTRDTKETVAYLTVMTRYLQSYFKGKMLQAVRIDDFQESARQFDINHPVLTLLTFEEFNQSSAKSKALTVQEMFGRQLIQLYGMSAHKARAIVNIYPTPSHLFSAYDMCTAEKEKEGLLSTVRCGKTQRNMGHSLSKQIYQLYCTPTGLY
ncbi:hypothetical protein CHS0354_040998 [Potamilus streckersoni]|uniref:Crossover junction endonuclease MUS81 n=1 Tax=Potamilus streckersoni TaxID=2493646 RepID=A0AAE0W3Q8_9BIVA|nr:hypothetical protein CHS0354_040998 [Potamilus streckersoni]